MASAERRGAARRFLTPSSSKRVEVQVLPPLLMQEQVYALFVDGTNLIHRAYHSMPPLTGPSGQPTGAVKGFANTLVQLIDRFNPVAVVVAFDTPTTGAYHCACGNQAVCYTQGDYGCAACCSHSHDCGMLDEVTQAYWHRQAQWASYKRGRGPKDEALVAQFEPCREIAEAVGCIWIPSDGWEADDVIASLCAQADRQHVHVIVSSDTDLIPLVDAHVDVYDPRGSDVHTLFWFAKHLRNPLFFALEGGHNGLPGVRGIGGVAASTIAGQYECARDLMSDLSTGAFEERMVKRCHQSPALARRWRRLLEVDPTRLPLMERLTTLKKDIKLPVLRSRLDAMSKTRVFEICAQLGFQSSASLVGLGQLGFEFEVLS